MNDIRVAELFAGIGGFRLGLEQANNFKCSSTCEKSEPKECWQRRQWPIDEQPVHFCPRPKPSFRVVWANELDKHASTIYRKNFGEKELIEADVKTINPKNIPDIDVLCGGFPCQPFSMAGKREGFQDIRGTLFFEIMRIAQAKRPKILFLENVKGLLSHDNGDTFETILRTLGNAGYWYEYKVLNSKFFGVPQNRKRVFIIGHLREGSTKQIFPFTSYDSEDSELGEVTGTLQGGGHSGGLHSNMTAIWQLPRNKDRKAVYGPDEVLQALRTCQKPPNPSIISNSIDTSGWLRQMGRHEVGKHGLTDYRIRRLSPTECERLQGFPDGWTAGVSDTQRYKCLGNAVTVNVIRAIGALFLEAFD